MKKILVSLSLIVLVTLGTSCSSDDNSNPKEITNEKTLVLSASAYSIQVGKEVAFTTTDGTSSVDAQVYLANEPIHNSMVFNTVGKFEIIAKKTGYTDSNVITIDVVAETNKLVGSWIPMNVEVKMPLSDPMQVPYPHQEACDQDLLTFEQDTKVSFAVHNESCETSITGTTWEFDEKTNMLKFNLYGQDMNVKVLPSSDANSLTVTAKGDQFAALIPILIPDMDMTILLPLLPMIEIELNLEKK